MKTIIFIFCLFWVACASSDLKARSVASDDTSFTQSIYCFFFSCDDDDAMSIRQKQEKKWPSHDAGYVCSGADANAEALKRWAGYILETVYNTDKDSYIIVMSDRYGRTVFRYIPSDCE